MVKISPSILSADFMNIGSEIKKLELSGADMLHLDVMDGHFVPNLTFGPSFIKAIREYTELPLDVHLMIEKPENWIEEYAKAGANYITIHPETTMHLDRIINQIKGLNIKVGIALLPTSNIQILEYILDKIDLILVMSVNPGFGGQQFIPNQLDKIYKLRQLLDNSNSAALLAVDGGINQLTAKQCVKQGADCLIAGNYIFSGNYKDRITLLKS